MKLQEKAVNILAVLAFDLLWLIALAVSLSALLGLNPTYLFYEARQSLTLGDLSTVAFKNLQSFGLSFFFICIFAPLWEELLFRRSPLFLAEKYVENHKMRIEVFKKTANYEFYDPFNLDPKKVERKILFHVIIMSSLIFGYLHGSALNVLVQGVFGMSWCWLYFKNDRCYWSTVIAHALWNFVVVWGLYFIV